MASTPQARAPISPNVFGPDSPGSQVVFPKARSLAPRRRPKARRRGFRLRIRWLEEQFAWRLGTEYHDRAFGRWSVDPVTEPNASDFTLSEDPFALFARWFAEARATEINDPEAMTLATVDAHGLPDARMVLCKQADRDGLVFYTNIESAKGRELAAQPRAAALFHWKSLRRQARFRGAVSEVTAAEREPDRRLGEPTISAARLARRSRSGGSSLRTAVRKRRSAATGVLARISP